ncbi:MAG TPA: hypothetical protein VIY86_12820, partial [Pirellulaceae bacterium]
MVAIVASPDPLARAGPPEQLPKSFRVLCLAAPRDLGQLVAEALRSVENSTIEVEIVERLDKALQALHAAAYETLLVVHSPPKLDAVATVRSFRGAVPDHQPIVVVGEETSGTLDVACLSAGADEYVSLPQATIPQLLWKIARSMERQNLLSESRLLRRNRDYQRTTEQDEVDRLLRQHWSLLGIASAAERGPVPPEDANLVKRYEQLLRALTV